MGRILRASLSLLAAALTGCPSKTPPPLTRTDATCALVETESGPAGTVAVTAETVVAGLEVPWGIGFLPGGDWLARVVT